jgi:hypothetical protein
MEKKKITETNAVAAVMDGIFQQVDERWGQLWVPVEQALQESGIKIEKSEFVKFNFSLAALAINFRASFDIFFPQQAERFFTIFQDLLLKQLGQGKGYEAVRNTIIKYMEAYNNGILKIRNPIYEVSMLLYYKIGLQNTEQKVVDETYFIPEPQMVDYLCKSLTMFSGKWDLLLERYDISTSASHTSDQHDAPPRDNP